MTMISSLEEEITTYIGIWLFLFILSWGFYWVTLLGISFIALFFTSWSMQAYRNLKPRNIIPIVKKKSVLVTGCDSGFGMSLAERLYELDFKVYAGCLLPEGKGAETLKKICPNIRILKLDVTSDSDTEAAVQTIKEEDSKDGNSLWSIVNNAGIACISEIEWCSMEMFRKVHEVNALGTVRITKAFIPLLRKTKNSRIVNVASLAGRYAPSPYGSYTMSKFAVVGFSDCLRMEMKKWGISVHTIEPTLYRTPITDIGPLCKNLDSLWRVCPDEVKAAYGEKYFQSFKDGLAPHIEAARPADKIPEVVDDMVDAVAGAQPKIRYVPSSEVRVKDYIISCLPYKIKDKMFSKTLTKVQPAACKDKNV